jgi:hypothetical protein
MATQYPGDKDKAPTQADFEKAWDNVKKDPKTAPKFIDGVPPKQPTTPAPKKFSKGGSASARADGCAVKGKTKGRYL